MLQYDTHVRLMYDEPWLARCPEVLRGDGCNVTVWSLTSGPIYRKILGQT